MKVRLVKVDNNVNILCADGTICKASTSMLNSFFTHFNEYSLFTGSEGRWDQEYVDMSEYPAETLAYVTDDGRLLVVDPWVMKKALTPPSIEEGKYITSTEYGKKHNRSREIIKAYLREGRIMGAIKVGRQWLVPADAPYPVDEVSRKPESGRTPYKK